MVYEQWLRVAGFMPLSARRQRRVVLLDDYRTARKMRNAPEVEQPWTSIFSALLSRVEKSD
jgi:hypothetical protein